MLDAADDPEAIEDDGGPGTAYTIRTAEGHVYARGMADLGELREQAERISYRCHAGTFPIEAAAAGCAPEPWGGLHVDGPGRWEIRSARGTIITPNATII
jgi:hypothetical protein